MSEKKFDIFVIGGGVNGCGIARDAAGRGLYTGLAEMDDLASATSSASTKLFHGGLRYLEYYKFRLVREALMRVLDQGGNLINCIKHRLTPRGIETGPPRRPLQPLNKDDKRELAEVIRTMDAAIAAIEGSPA